jgi:hypothetical protein
MNIRRILALAVPLAALGFLYSYVATHQLQTRNADGVYFNRCCGIVYLQGEKLTTRRGVVPVHQAVMKFGLTVFLERDPRLFTRDTAPLDPDKLPSLQFDKVNNPGYFDISDVGVGVYRFRRCACDGNCCQSRT